MYTNDDIRNEILDTNKDHMLIIRMSSFFFSLKKITMSSHSCKIVSKSAIFFLIYAQEVTTHLALCILHYVMY